MPKIEIGASRLSFWQSLYIQYLFESLLVVRASEVDTLFRVEAVIQACCFCNTGKDLTHTGLSVNVRERTQTQ